MERRLQMRLWLRGVKRFVVLLHRYKATRKSLEQCNKGEYPFIPAAPAPFRTHTRTHAHCFYTPLSLSLSLDHIHFKLYTSIASPIACILELMRPTNRLIFALLQWRLIYWSRESAHYFIVAALKRVVSLLLMLLTFPSLKCQPWRLINRPCLVSCYNNVLEMHTRVR